MHQRIDSIDCLRGIAILAVLLVHGGQAVAGLPEWLHSLISYGGRGVQLFFILSAVTLLTVYRNHDFSPRAFLIRRFFRLAPMFYLGIGFYLLYHGLEPRPNAPNGIGLQQVLLTLTFLHGWGFDSINSVVPGGWSIAAEAMFYAAFPFLLPVLTTLRRSVMAFIIACVISRASFVFIPQLFADHATPHLLDLFAAFSFPTQLPAFIGGFVVYFTIQRLNGLRTVSYKITVQIACIFIATLIVCCAASGNKTLSNYLLAVGLLMLFVLAVHLAQPRIIVNAALRHIGRISYSLYLIHFAVLDGVAAMVLPIISNATPVQQLLLIYGGTLTASAALATITWRCIELPAIALGRRITERHTLSS